MAQIPGKSRIFQLELNNGIVDEADPRDGSKALGKPGPNPSKIGINGKNSCFFFIFKPSAFLGAGKNREVEMLGIGLELWNGFGLGWD